MKNLKKLTSFIIALTLTFGIFCSVPIKAGAITGQQGADWATSRIGWWIDVSFRRE